MRLAFLYGGLFLASGIALVTFTDALVGVQSSRRTVRVPTDRLVPQGIAFPPRQSPGNLHFLVVYSIIAVVGLIAVSTALGWLVAGRALRPFGTIVATARDISATNLHERLRLDGPYDEFQELGETLDDLFGRLESSFESQRHFVANASHELRTPLTAQRTLLQVALADPDATVETLRSTCQEILTVGQQQERLIAALLTLADSEGGVHDLEAFDLAELAEGAVLVHQHEASRRGIDVDATLNPAPAAGDPSLVESLVANLLDNGLRHNQPGGRVEISTGMTGGRATISIRNTGPVIPVDQVDRLLEPFQRLGEERTRGGAGYDGHGLGLAIVQAIANAHGARLSVQPRPGGGLDVAVTFRP
jgi:signal transduction histidine kinase